MAALLGAPAARGVSDEERIAAYHEFRAAFDAHRFAEALPLAQQVVELTEIQYGEQDRSLVTPLANLGTTQYRLRDYKDAEAAYLRSIQIAEASGGNADRLLLAPLHGLGATYFASGQYDDARLALKRALDLSRNVDGLLNVGQLPILDALISSLSNLERHEEVERDYQYELRIAETAYGKSDVRLLHPLEQYAHWLEHIARYVTARALYARALSLAEQAGKRAAALSIEPLHGIARTYRLEFVNGGEEESIPAPDPFAPGAEFNAGARNNQRLNPDGERALQLALQIIDKAQPVDHASRGATLIELGDWYMSAGIQAKGLAEYRDAWQELVLAGSTSALAAPRQLAYRPPSAAVTRSRLSERDNVEEHFVEVSFTVTRDGRTGDITTTATDASESQQKLVITAVRRARYAPRFENGEPTDTQGVTLRERLLAKRPR